MVEFIVTLSRRKFMIPVLQVTNCINKSVKGVLCIRMITEQQMQATGSTSRRGRCGAVGLEASGGSSRGNLLQSTSLSNFQVSRLLGGTREWWPEDP